MSFVYYRYFFGTQCRYVKSLFAYILSLPFSELSRWLGP